MEYGIKHHTKQKSASNQKLYVLKNNLQYFITKAVTQKYPETSRIVTTKGL